MSIFVHVDEDKTPEQCQALGKVLQDKINVRWQATLKEEFAIESQLEIEFETHFSKFLMPSIRGQDVGKEHKTIGTKAENFRLLTREFCGWNNFTTKEDVRFRL